MPDRCLRMVCAYRRIHVTWLIVMVVKLELAESKDCCASLTTPQCYFPGHRCCFREGELADCGSRATCAVMKRDSLPWAQTDALTVSDESARSPPRPRRFKSSRMEIGSRMSSPLPPLAENGPENSLLGRPDSPTAEEANVAHPKMLPPHPSGSYHGVCKDNT